MDDIEEWRDIPGREGCYQASSLGRVKSLPRSRTPGGILKEYNRSGYPSVTLSSPTTGGKFELVHRVILLTFVGPCPDGHEGLHRDGNSFNNRLSNLRWGTRQENIADLISHGTWRAAMDERRVLTEEQAEFVRQNHKVITQSDLAKMFGVHRATIQRIHSGERYARATLSP